jgi:hypothetical protein
MPFQVGFDVICVQYQVDDDQDEKKEGGPLMDVPQNMPQNVFPSAIPPWQQKPVDRTGHSQNTQQYKRKHIHHPQPGGPLRRHIHAPSGSIYSLSLSPLATIFESISKNFLRTIFAILTEAW